MNYQFIANLASEIPKEVLETLKASDIYTLEDLAYFLTDKKSVEWFDSLLANTSNGEGSINSYYDLIKSVDISSFDKIPDEILAQIDNREIFTYDCLFEESKDLSQLAMAEEDADIDAVSLNLINNFFPIKNQGKRGTCVAFATTSMYEYLHNNTTNYSENYLYWGCKQIDVFKNMSGTSINAAFHWLTKQHKAKEYEEAGICEASYWEYDPSLTHDNMAGDPDSKAKSNAVKNRLKDFRQLHFTQIKSALYGTNGKDGSPVVFAIPVYRSWMKHPKVYRYGEITSMPTFDEKSNGGHAMLFTGFINSKNYAGGGVFIFRNSWGEDWGSEVSEVVDNEGNSHKIPSGYGIISYSLVEKYGRDFFVGEVEAKKVTPKDDIKPKKEDKKKKEPKKPHEPKKPEKPKEPKEPQKPNNSKKSGYIYFIIGIIIVLALSYFLVEASEEPAVASIVQNSTDNEENTVEESDEVIDEEPQIVAEDIDENISSEIVYEDIVVDENLSTEFIDYDTNSTIVKTPILLFTHKIYAQNRLKDLQKKDQNSTFEIVEHVDKQKNINWAIVKVNEL